MPADTSFKLTVPQAQQLEKLLSQFTHPDVKMYARRLKTAQIAVQDGRASHVRGSLNELSELLTKVAGPASIKPVIELLTG